MYKVAIEDARFWSIVGLYPEEKQIPNEISISIIIGIKTLLDKLPMIDYVSLYQIAKESVANHSDTLENILQSIVMRCNEIIDYQYINVIVRKNHPPTGSDVNASIVSWEENKFANNFVL